MYYNTHIDSKDHNAKINDRSSNDNLQTKKINKQISSKKMNNDIKNYIDNKINTLKNELMIELKTYLDLFINK